MEKKYFAKVNNETNEIEGVYIYSETPSFPEDELWIETFQDGSQRKHFAGIGFTYYPEYDAFVPPNVGTSASRVLNLDTFEWDPVVEPPEVDLDLYYYDDDYCQWITLVGPANNGGFNNADLLVGFSTETSGKLWNIEGKIMGVMSTT